MPAALPAEFTVRIWRGGQGSGGFADYLVPARDNQTVLDIVTDVQRHQEPTLAYRFACRVGVCGTCAMTVNGKPRWTCRTLAKKVAVGHAISIEPLRNLPRIKDLVCDMREFFDKWQRAGGHFASARTRADAVARIAPSSGRRKAVDAAIECINCAVCYAACDVVTWNGAYLGPAALNRAWTLLNDERHIEKKTALRTVTRAGGCASCHTVGSCTVHCPVGISPTESIAGLRRMSLLNFLGGT